MGRIQSFILALAFLFISQLPTYSSLNCPASDGTSDGACTALGSIGSCAYTNNLCNCDSALSAAFYVSLSTSAITGATANFDKEVAFLSTVMRGALRADSELYVGTYGTSFTHSAALQTSWTYAGLATEIAANLPASAYDAVANTMENRLPASLSQINTALSASTMLGKYAVVLVNAYPGSSALVTGRLNPCSTATLLKQNGIRVILVLIGTDTVDFDVRGLTCLVSHPATDIVLAADYDALAATAAATVVDLLCADYYEFKITEVKPTNSAGGDRFVEIYNYGMAIAAGALAFSDFVVLASSGAPAIAQGAYYSLDETGATSVATNAVLGWTQTVTDGTGTDTVVQATTVGFEIEEAYSYALVPWANNDYGGNWYESCGTGGTPGAENLLTSAGNLFQCASPDCDDGATSCNFDAGVTGVVCSLSLCVCPINGAFFTSGPLCLPVPPPSNCHGYKYKVADGTQHIEFYWDRAEYDRSDIQYVVNYFNAADTPTEAFANRNSLTVEAPNTRDTALVQAYVKSRITANLAPYDSAEIECYIDTVNPSTAPTRMPSAMPSPGPTAVPSPAPTFRNPNYYFRIPGCDARCACAPFFFTEGSACCAGVEAAANLSKCPVPELAPVQVTGHIPDQVGILEFPAGFLYESTVCWTLSLYDTISGDDDGDDNTTTTTTTTLAPNTTASPRVSQWGIDVEPRAGCVVFNAGNANVGDIKLLDFIWKANSLADNCGGKAAHDECVEYMEVWELAIVSCEVDAAFAGVCSMDYPRVIQKVVQRTDCDTVCPVKSSKEQGIPMWVWWILIALVVFLIILAILIYRFWWKGKKDTGELEDREKELDEVHDANEQGFGADLDVGDVAFNPMATGVPGTNQMQDTFGAEMEQRQFAVQNDIADTKVEKFEVRMDYGQVQSSNNR